MTAQFAIGGVYLSPIIPEVALALFLTALLSVLLVRSGFYRFVWHRPLVEVAIFCILLALLAGAPLVGVAR
ncbi:DUF1656 domain-containing protein [Sphingomonas morindae]|uniref:DUF1656 domain-containing protein n=1 Tax=Sphingomonas morindae TaxID=1541170 RepID=A0ABY4XB12_9SPHN|nr:DUF1656 domain-containing protein [Sphingomonas morindae]USI73895.1 DUF1656 domain-containing protein [Sphingomonas morindae]